MTMLKKKEMTEKKGEERTKLKQQTRDRKKVEVEKRSFYSDKKETSTGGAPDLHPNLQYSIKKLKSRF